VSPVDTSAGRSQLSPLVQAAFGGRRYLMGVTRLRGASKKGVYRATLDDASTVIVYAWSSAEDWWSSSGPEPGTDRADPFSHASGLDLFEAAQAHLDRLGVRIPRVYLVDRSHEHHDADIALVEDITGPNLEDLLNRDDPRARPAVEQLAAMLRVMQSDKAPAFGKLGHLTPSNAAPAASCVQAVLDRALRDLAESSARDQRIAQHQAQLTETLRMQAAAVAPRPDCSLVHGELGPDHVLIDHQDRPVIIDIEGLMYFDVEWEHVFLQLRFGRAYPLLHPGGLDPDRLDLYRLAMHLSLVAAPLRLLDGDYSERDQMMEIAEYNLQQVLALRQPS
jgi:Phosphotransferase enzyme family